jgi:uncharacterized membrane protein (DUF373 family)
MAAFSRFEKFATNRPIACRTSLPLGQRGIVRQVIRLIFADDVTRHPESVVERKARNRRRRAMSSETKDTATAPTPDADLRRTVFKLYDRVVEFVILGIIPLMLVALGFAFIQAVIGTAEMFPGINAAVPDETTLRNLVERVLDVIILIELFNTFMEYARTRHIRLSNLLDVTIVFALRETLIKLYAQVFASLDLLALCILVIVLVVARSITSDNTRDERRG